MPVGALTVRCIRRGGLLPQMEGPTHRYMESSPGCWYAHGEVLSREYSDQESKYRKNQRRNPSADPKTAVIGSGLAQSKDLLYRITND